MKSILRATLLIAALYIFAGCRKTNDLGPQITGSWVMTEAQQYTPYGWRFVQTPVDGGRFDFSSNGNVSYSDFYGDMYGSWSIATVRDGYYDEFGNYYTDLHDVMRIDMRDPSTAQMINLYFNDLDYQGSVFYGTYYNGSYIVRYRFERY